MINEKEINWRTSPGMNFILELKCSGLTYDLAIQDFVIHTPWQDERGQPFSNVAKNEIIQILNNPSKSDIAAISFLPSSDHIELWYTKLRPFAENGHWVTIPGFAAKVRELNI